MINSIETIPLKFGDVDYILNIIISTALHSLRICKSEQSTIENDTWKTVAVVISDRNSKDNIQTNKNDLKIIESKYEIIRNTEEPAEC